MKGGELVIGEDLDWGILLIVNEIPPGGELVTGGGFDERIVLRLGGSEREDNVVYVDSDVGGMLVAEVLTVSGTPGEGKEIGVLLMGVSVGGGRTVVGED